VRVLVTGATGFVGRWLLPELEAAGHEAVAAPSSADLDLASSPDLGPLIRSVRPDAVAHLAAVTFVPDATRDPDRAWRVNVDGTTALFAGLAAEGSQAAVLVASSADVYGTPDSLPVRETAELRPQNAYGRSKVAQEEVARAAARAARSVVLARSFNHIGPGQRPTFIAPKLARDVLRLQSGDLDSIPVGDVTTRRDFVDVRDVVLGYRLLLEVATGSRVEGAPYNVGSGRSVAISELLARLCELAGVEPRWHVDPDQFRPNEIPDRYADITAIRALTGWEPRIPLDQSLRDVLASASV
jgi:GDP-4-dehydro-6-deoxy-D-mannose reductase